MVVNCIEEKVKVNNWNELSNIPMKSWVDINGTDELKVAYDHPKGEIYTLSLEDNYVCQKSYNIFLGSLTPVCIEKFLKGTGKGQTHLKIIEENQ